MTTKNLPGLSSLMSTHALPASLSILGDNIGFLLDRLRYQDLKIEKSPDNVTAYYGLTLLTREVAVDFFGSGLRIVFFPTDDLTTTASALPVSFEYRWPILKYMPAFETLSFDGTSKAFFNICLELVDITEAQFLDGIVACFIDDPQPYTVLVDLLKQWQGGSSALSALTLSDPPVGYTEIEYILQQIEDIRTTTQTDIDIFEAAYDAVIADVGSFDDILDKLVALFRGWLGYITRAEIEALLVPQFAVALTEVSMAIEVPRTVLIPIDDDNAEIAEPAHSRLTFTAGGVAYDSSTGFDIRIADDVSASLTRSTIPNFGLTLDFDDIKIDLSRATNIAQADADGRPADFMGVYVGNAVIGLPAKWFAQYQPPNSQATTVAIVGRGLLIGTGGLSGTVGLEVVTLGKPDKDSRQATDGVSEIEFVLGQKPDSGDRKGFRVGFSAFDMEFRQNVLLHSRIKGSLTIPKFQAGPIEIELFIDRTGDFELTASVPGGHDFEWPDVFIFKAKEVKVGKDGGKVYLDTTGDLIFPPGTILGNLLKAPIALKNFLVHSDGSIELKGGDIPLPESVSLTIGPAKIAITALHFGSHTQDHDGLLREYRYFGLDAAVSVDPGRCGGRGDGIKFYYTVDNDPATNRNKHQFLRIEGLGIDLCIPGSASEAEAALILKGYLALKDPVYEGSISFKLMKGKIVGGASMKYDTSYPAWLVDVNLKLPTAIQLGSTPLGLSSLRGMFGLRYIASKSAINPPLATDASWGDYFRAPQDVKGVTYKKFVTPDASGGPSNPFSIGVGAGLITIADTGKLFSSQLFLMVSLPNLIMLEGRFDVMADQPVSVDDDPPYYAYLALSPETIEMGAGVNYALPKDSGTILDINAVMEAAYFFHNASAWYMNLGTKTKPMTARIISLFDGYSYLMLSASGVEMGAGVSFDFAKGYGPVSVTAHAYLDTWAYIAFQHFQAGGGIALGGYLDARLFKCSLHIELAATLTVEVPKPFYVAGSVHVCVSVNLKVKTFSTCFDMEFKWEKSNVVDRSPIEVMVADSGPPCVAQHMVSGTTYPVIFSDQADLPAGTQIPAIPLDCYVDVKFTKPVDPSAVADRIGGYTSPPTAQREAMPPRYGSRVVHHAYSIDDVRIDILGSGGQWVPYHPYKALAQAAMLDAATVTQMETLPLGVWQKQDATYGRIRFLGQTPFSWMGDNSTYCPEEMGITARSTWCVARERTKRCLTWPEPARFAAGTDYAREGVLYRVDNGRAEAVSLPRPGLSPISLAISPGSRAQFRFTGRAVTVAITVFSTAPSITVRWQRRKPVADVLDQNGNVVFGPWTAVEFEDVGAAVIVPYSALPTHLDYHDPAHPIDRVVIETPEPDRQVIAGLQDQIARLNDDWVRSEPGRRPAIVSEIAALNRRLAAEFGKVCITDAASSKAVTALIAQREKLAQQVETQQKAYAASCRVDADRTKAATAPTPTPAPKGLWGRLVGMVSRVVTTILQIVGIVRKPKPVVDCAKLAADIAALQAQVNAIDAQIAALRAEAARTDAKLWPPGWTCGTFVHNVCWLSLEDHAFNTTIPDIAAIAADYDRMRRANETVIAPIWQPRQTYRIAFTASDAVTDEQGHTAPKTARASYIHFRTDGPIGYFNAELPLPAETLTAPASAVPDDGRPEMAERSLKFYIDEKSTPDPSGNILYAQPVYYHDVVLRLFFSHPHAYHFFTQWPDVGAGPRNYALELAVKDPAEATPLPPSSAPLSPHETVHVGAPVPGAQSWTTDPAPRLTNEIRTMRTFQNPIPAGDDSGLVCLTTGGAPITPLSKALEFRITDLEPAKLYTAVVLNRSLDENTVAEVARYPFRTSIYASFHSHIFSYQLSDSDQNEALAVYAHDHDLGANELTILVNALAIITGAPSTQTAAYTDPFDRLIFECLQLASPAPAPTTEFNFVGNTFGLWIRSPEPLIDPRVPSALLDSAIGVIVGGLQRTDTHVLFSKDRCQAFVMTSSAAFPTQDVAIAFTRQTWTGNAYAADTVVTDPFNKP